MYLEVLVFVQNGCPACHEITPLVERMGAHYGQCVSTRIVDVHREGLLADRMRITETPTVIGCVAMQPVIRLVSAQDFEPRMVNLYDQLLREGSCPVAQPWTRDV